MTESLDEFLDEFEIDDIFPEQSTSDQPPEIYLKCLKDWFGHSSFRPMQWQVISSILDKKQDNCVIFSTGYGKSLCYQFPSVFLDTVTVVISPLIALMEDQVLSLKVSNIKACLLGSAQKDKEILNEVFKLKYNIVYVSPEFITGALGTQILRELRTKLTLIAIDEAHCISKWGHDFRPAFRNLSFIRRLVPEVPILALTATATEQVRNDVVKSLQLRDPQILCSGFDRPNLEFNVRMKSNHGMWADIGTILKSVRIGSIIIYCITRSETERIAELIRAEGLKCAAYHAGLSITQRKALHEDFVKDKIQVIVATIAFGMGVDKPDVRIIIHYGASRDIESYYQEVGRAGRDGMPAKCFMFYSRSDFITHESIRQSSRVSEEIQRNLEVLSSKMKEYVNIDKCRRKYLLDYFEGSSVSLEKRKTCCDNCRSGFSSMGSIKKYEDLDDNGLYDFTEDAENLLKAIQVFKGFTGLHKPILLLRGSSGQKLAPTYFSHPMYGVGKSKSDEWYKSLADLLEANKFLQREPISTNKYTKTYFKTIYAITLSTKAISWLENNEKSLKLKPPLDMLRYLKRVKPQFLNDMTNLNIVQSKQNTDFDGKIRKDSAEELIKSLHRVRSSLASSLDVMPYMIASNKALHQIAQKKPLNIDEMKSAQFDGFSETKVAKFGPAFIKCILESINFLPSNDNSMDIKHQLKKHPIPGVKITDTHLRTFDLWKAGKSIEEIAQIRGLSASTVSNYMNELIKTGLCATKTDLRKLGVGDVNFKAIAANIPQNFSSVKLKDMKEACGSNITYDMIKYVLSYYQVRKHLRDQNIVFLDPDDNFHKFESLPQNLKIDNYKCNTTPKMPSCIAPSTVVSSGIVPKIPKVSGMSEEIDIWDSGSDVYFKDLGGEVKQYNSSTNINSISDKAKETVKNTPEYSNNKLDLSLFNSRKSEEPTSQTSKSVSLGLISPCNKIQHTSNDVDVVCKDSPSTCKKRKFASRSKIQFEDSSSEDENPRQKVLLNSNSSAKSKSIKSVFS